MSTVHNQCSSSRFVTASTANGDKILEHFLSELRVIHFRVKLQTKAVTRFVFHALDLARRAAGRDEEPFGTT